MASSFSSASLRVVTKDREASALWAGFVNKMSANYDKNAWTKSGQALEYGHLRGGSEGNRSLLRPDSRWPLTFKLIFLFVGKLVQKI